MNRVAIDQNEAEWFSRNVLKTIELLEASERKNPGVRERRTYKTFVSIRDQAIKAGEATVFPVNLMLSDKAKRLVKELVLSVHKNLIERVIPEYKKRGESHVDYLENAEMKAEKLRLMARKFR